MIPSEILFVGVAITTHTYPNAIQAAIEKSEKFAKVKQCFCDGSLSVQFNTQ